jgi:hypothetical protein
MGEMKSKRSSLVQGLLRRLLMAQGSRGLAQMMAELLSGVTPETVFNTVLEASISQSQTYQNCLEAALYVAAFSEPIQRRDAARFLVYMMIEPLLSSVIRERYREVILAPSAAANDNLSRLDTIMREELGRMNKHLPKLIAQQHPISPAEKQQAAMNILSKFSDMT